MVGASNASPSDWRWIDDYCTTKAGHLISTTSLIRLSTQYFTLPPTIEQGVDVTTVENLIITENNVDLTIY